MAVGQAAVFEHLQQHIEDVWMGLLYLVHQHHRIRFATHRFGQVTAFFVTDVARRRTDQARNGVLLHELGHVDADHRLLGIEEELGQRLAKLGLAHPGRAEKEERAARTIRVGQTGARAAHGIGYGHHGFVLTDDASVQHVFHAQQLVALAFEHLGDRDTGPLGNHLGDLLVGHLVTQQLVFFLAMLIDHLQAALEVRNDAVLQFGHARQITLASRCFELGLGLFDLLLDLRRTLHLGFLRLPDFFQIGVFALQLGDVVFQLGQALLGGLVVFLLQRLTLDLQLDQAAIQAIELFGLGVDLHADTAGGLVDQVDGLVRQLAIGDIAVAELGRGDDGAIGDGHAMVHFVALLEATKNGDGVFLAWFVDQHLLEATLQGGILLDVLAVFIESSGTYAVQLAARQGRLEHVAGIHGAFRLARADHRMQLVDEQDDATLLLGQLVEHRLEALLELAAELGPGNQRAHVQGQQALVLEPVRDLTVDDALGQPLDDGGLAHARLTNQYRVVLGPPLQHLNGAADLVVTTDHRVELAVLGALGHVHGVFVERLPRFFGVGIIDRIAAAQIADGVLQRFLAYTLSQQQLAQTGVAVQRCQQHQFTGNVLVALLLGEAVSLIEQARQVLREIHVAGGVL